MDHAGVLRGQAAHEARAARLDVDLRRSKLARQLGPQTTLVDPSLERMVTDLATRARQEARAEGYAAGWAEGSRAGRAELRDQAAREQEVAATRRAEQERAFDSALAGLARATEQLQQRTAPSVAEAADGLAALAFALTEQLLARELQLAADPGRDAVARALAAVPGDVAVTVRLNPADLAALAELPAPAGRPLNLVPDPAVEPGGALADCGAMHVDAQLSTALDRLRQVLAP